MKILWLGPPNFSKGLQFRLKPYLEIIGLTENNMYYTSLHYSCKTMIEKRIKRGKKDFLIVINPNARNEVFTNLTQLISNIRPQAIVINDEATLGFFNERQITSLPKCRGSVYFYNKIPCIVMDEVQKLIYAIEPRVAKDDDEQSIRWYTWIFMRDLAKTKRWAEGKPKNIPDPNIKIALMTTDIFNFARLARKAIFISHDIETRRWPKPFITCMSFTAIFKDGSNKTLVIPFYNPTKINNCHWIPEEECDVWYWIKKLLQMPVPKIYQNGPYDLTYLLYYNIPVDQYWLDLYYLFHAMWSEAPRNLAFICSTLLDKYRYWKDDSKDEDDFAADDRIMRENFNRYLNYNGLDTYYTAYATIAMLNLIQPYGLTNYIRDFPLTRPALLASMTGLLVDQDRRSKILNGFKEELETKLADLKLMVSDPDFNQNSPVQVASLIYDVLKAQPLLKGEKERTTDKKYLNIIKFQHPLLEIIINQLIDVKEAANNLSKYEKGLTLINNRWYFRINSSATKTNRAASRKHNLGYGTQGQNIPKPIRAMCVADEGYEFLEVDYSQSDMYYTAYQTGDEELINLLNDPRDTHCINAAYFFSKPYEEVYNGYKNDEEWVVHSTKGVRQNTKRIVYGAHYFMMGFTLYVTMGHEAAIATAEQIGYKDASKWKSDQLIKFCGKLIEMYHEKYPTTFNQTREIIKQTNKNFKLFTDCWGQTRLFFGDLINDNSTQRELASQIGQAGTSGAINKALYNLYYKTNFFDEGGLLSLQLHDSMLVQIPKTKPHLRKLVVDTVHVPCQANGRQFVVPVDAMIGHVWNKKEMVPLTFNNPGSTSSIGSTQGTTE